MQNSILMLYNGEIVQFGFLTNVREIEEF